MKTSSKMTYSIKSKSLILGLASLILISLPSLVLAKPIVVLENGEGSGGGDICALQFSVSAKKVLQQVSEQTQLRNWVGAENLQKMHNTLSNYKIKSTNQEITEVIAGKIFTYEAFTFNDEKLILLSRPLFCQLVMGPSKIKLIAHELFVSIGLESTGKFQYSSQLIAADEFNPYDLMEQIDSNDIYTLSGIKHTISPQYGPKYYSQSSDSDYSARQIRVLCEEELLLPNYFAIAFFKLTRAYPAQYLSAEFKDMKTCKKFENKIKLLSTTKPIKIVVDLNTNKILCAGFDGIDCP